MAGKTAILSVRVVSDTKNAQRGAADTATAWEKAQKRIDKLAGVATLVGAGMVALGKVAVDAASRLEQSTGGVESVFKQYASEITSFAKTAWDTVGLSQSEAQEQATLLGAQLKNLGVPMDEVAGKSLDLVKLGADLAATYGGTTSDAVSALSSLLRGERDPIEKFGVSFKQADIDAQKLAMGLDGLTGEAEKQANIQATLALLTSQTADAQGQAAREYDTVAAAQQRLGAVWENTAATLGEALLPAVAEGTDLLAGLAVWVQENEGLVMSLAKGLAVAAGSVVALSVGIKTVKVVSSVFAGVRTAVGITQSFVAGLTSAKAAASAFTGVAGTLGGKVAALVRGLAAGAAAAAKWAIQTAILTAKFVAQKIATVAIAVANRAAAVAQGIWNAIMNANPLMLIITLVIAAIVLLIANWDKVKTVAVAVWDAIKTAALWFWDNVLVPIGEFIATVFTTYWETLQTVAVAVWDAIKTAALWLWDNALKPLGEFIVAVFIAYWQLLGDVAVAVWNAIKTAALWLWDNALKPLGEFIVAVFIAYWQLLGDVAVAVWNGIKTAASKVWDWLKQVGAWITGTFKSAWNGLRSAGVNALNAIISPVRNLISWLQDAWDWVQKLFSSGANKLGSIFGFSAKVEAGAPVTAAASSAPSVAGLAALKGGETKIEINIELPQYVGDKRELLAWLQAALAEAERKKNRLITA